jgi:long-subunit fatty acid transport protein
MGVQFAALGIPFAPDFRYKARVTVKLPQTAIVSGRWQASPALGVSLQGDFANYGSAFHSLPVHLTQGSNADINGFLHSSSIDDTIPLNWRNQFSVRAAMDRSLGEHYGLDVGFLHRGNLVPNSTVSPLTGVIMKNGLSGGLHYDRERLHTAAGYSYQFNQSATVGTSALLAGEYDHSRLTVGTQALVLEITVRSRTH